MGDKKMFEYSVGDVLEVSTFAGPKVHKKVLKKIDYTVAWSDETTTRVVGFEGCFVRRKDLFALKKMSVPYTGREKLKETRSFTYDSQILREVSCYKRKT